MLQNDLLLTHSRIEQPKLTWNHRTRRIYDRLADVYHVSAALFHSRAHARAVHALDVRDGMRVLEVATGSGEMFTRLVAVNRNGQNVGVDLSPRMAAHTRRRVHRRFPSARILCQAVDARSLPFQNGVFQRAVCCYLLELLAANDILRVMREFHRVLAPDGRLALISIGQNVNSFNRMYRLLGSLEPNLWGRQIDTSVRELMGHTGFRLVGDHVVRQGIYPSHVWIAAKRG